MTASEGSNCLLEREFLLVVLEVPLTSAREIKRVLIVLSYGTQRNASSRVKTRDLAEIIPNQSKHLPKTLRHLDAKRLTLQYCYQVSAKKLQHTILLCLSTLLADRKSVV